LILQDVFYFLSPVRLLEQNYFLMNKSLLINTIQKIENACFSNPYSRDMIETDIQKSNTVILLASGSGRILSPETEEFSKNEIIAAYCLIEIISQEQIMELIRVAVIPEFRKRGYGEKLLRKMEDLALEKNMDRILLEVSKINSSAIKLYEKMGYMQYHTRKSYYPDGSDARLYQKILRTA